MENTQFYDLIAKDSKQALIQLVSEAGHGKTSSLRTIIQHVRRKHPDIVFKIFDVSQAWYHQAPTQWRQLVTLPKMAKGLVANLDDCVYEMGSLSKEYKRAFVGMILKADWDKRYQAKLEGRLDEYPLMAYVFEESNIYFGSYALRTNDDYTPVFQSYVSVGRNYKMRGFLVATAEQGEMSPSLRRRTRKIYGRIISKGDLSLAKRSGITEDLTRIPKYHFHYYDNESKRGITQRIPDLVKNVPKDYVVEVAEVVEESNQFDDKWWFTFFATLAIFLLFWSWLMRL